MIDQAIRNAVDQAAPITLDEVLDRVPQPSSAVNQQRAKRRWLPRAAIGLTAAAILMVVGWQRTNPRPDHVETAIGTAASPAAISTPTLADKPSIDRKPGGYISAQARGTTDPLESAQLFLDMQFPAWSSVELTLDETDDRGARVRWVDTDTGVAGWIVLFFADGAYAILDLSTDGFAMDLSRASDGGRGFAQSVEPVVVELYPEVGGRDDSDEIVARFEIPALPQGTDPVAIETPPSALLLRAFLYDEAGTSRGFAFVSIDHLGWAGPLHELIVITALETTDDLDTFVRAHPQLVADHIIRDPWLSADMITRLTTTDDLPVVRVDDVPLHHLTQIALRDSGAEGLDEFMAGLATRGIVLDTLTLPWPYYDEAPLENVARYIVAEIPSPEPCRLLGASGEPNRAGTVDSASTFENPADAAALAPIPRAESDHLWTEFISNDGVVLGYGWHRSGEPRTWLTVVEVEQTADGWRATNWETVNC